MEQKELEQIKKSLQYRFDLFKGRQKDYLYFVAVKDYANFIISNPFLKAFIDTTVDAPKVVLDKQIEEKRELIYKDIDNLYAKVLPEIKGLESKNEELDTTLKEFNKNNEYNDVSLTASNLKRIIEIAASLTPSPFIHSLCTLTKEGGFQKIKATDDMYYDVSSSTISPVLPEFEKLVEKKKKQGETMLWGSFTLLGTAAACVRKIENGETDNPSYYVEAMMEVWQESSPNSNRLSPYLFDTEIAFPNSVSSLPHKLYNSTPIRDRNYFRRIDYDFHAQKIHNCLVEFIDQQLSGASTENKVLYEKFDLKTRTLYLSNKPPILISRSGKETYPCQLLQVITKNAGEDYFEDQILDEWGYRDFDLKDMPRQQVYQSAIKINDIVKKEAQLSDFIEFTTKRFRINNKYLKSL